MTRPTSLARFSRITAIALLCLAGAGCVSKPVVRAQTVPGGNLTNYKTYGFMEKLGTDDSTYSSALSVNLKAATARELEARGYRAAPAPDLLVNFHLVQKDKIEGSGGPTFGIGVGSMGYRGGMGVGVSTADVSTKTQGTLSIDVVDRARNEIVWTGSAEGEITRKVLDDPKGAVDTAVPMIFGKFPGRATPAP